MELTIDQALQKAVEAHKEGKIQDADRLYTAILKIQPKHPDANHNLGVLAISVGKVQEGLPFLKVALKANPKIAQFWLSYIDALIKLDRIADAKSVLDQAKSKGAKGDEFDKLGKQLQKAGQAPLETDQIVAEPQPKQPNILDSLKLDQAIKLAKKNEGDGALEEAKRIYQDVLLKFPKNKQAKEGLKRLDRGANGSTSKIQDPPQDHVKSLINLYNQGQLEQAINQANALIKQFPKSGILFSIQGAILKGLGQVDASIEAYKNALIIRPDNAEVYNNVGVSFQEQGKLEEAIKAYNKALAIKPDYAEAYYNMGIAFQEQGKIEEAIEAYNNALSIKPNYAKAYHNLGNILKNVRFSKANQRIEDAIVSILDLKTIVRPREISHAALSLIKCHPKFKDLLSSKSRIKSTRIFQEVSEQISREPLLLKLMSVCPLHDLDFEKILCELRSFLVRNIADIAIDSSLLKLQSALALQCFTNEYVYNFDERDAVALHDLQEVVSNTIANGCQPQPHIILCIASFTALHEYEWSDRLKSTADLEDVMRRQITEPNEEYALKPNIDVLGEINDEISAKVREQYEENPYPRWVNLGLRLEPASISQICKEIKLKLANEDILSVDAPDILIAGCGTGQQSIGTKARFKNSKVLAIDLSISSLAYAKRKTQELDMHNINYMQADILQLRSLDRQFDIIESAGVLHHMDDPIVGWKVLVDCLRTGGIMKIGLYSELARKPVVEYRNRIAKAGLVATEHNIRSVRATIAESEDDSSKQIRSWQGYYSMSELRDLLFHVQEHRFAIPQIKDCLGKLGLKFCGFEANHIVSAFKESNPTIDAEYDLDEWHTFENDNPSIFMGMYQFWCQKIG